LKKVIVTQRIDYIDNYREIRESIDQALSNWLIQANFLPIPITNSFLNTKINQNLKVKNELLIENFLSTIKPDALLLSGGNNIGEYLSRDKTEKFLLDWSYNNRLPVLGICRGMQMMSVWSGGKLSQVKNHVGTRHKLKICGSDKKWPTDVNSFHEWGLSNCPSGFELKALTCDGEIEAFKHKDLPWEGWMWHPEREATFNGIDQMRFKRLVNNEK
jgi:N5-(cytidine 5'-diphosphoramidyl)-L-glutamine hydrolase